MSAELDHIEQLLNQGEFRKAGSLIERLGAEATSSQGLYLKAKIAYLSQNYTLAIQTLEGHPSNTPEVLELLGDAYLSRFQYAPVGHSRRNDLEHTISAFSILLKTYPQYDNAGWVHYRTGLALALSDEHKTAIEHFRQSIHLPANDTAIKSYAYERIAHITFYVERDFKQALSLLELAIAVYPSDRSSTWLIQAYLFKARVLQILKRESDVALAAQQAVKLARQANELAEICDTLLASGDLLAQINGQEQNAMNYLREYLSLRSAPEGVDVAWSRANEILGDLLFALTDYSSALTAYQAVIQYNPYHPLQAGIYYRIAKSHYQLGQYPATIKTIRGLLELTEHEQGQVTDFRVFDILGSAQFAIGQYHEAAESYRQALDLSPSATTAEKIRLYHHYAIQLASSKM